FVHEIHMLAQAGLSYSDAIVAGTAGAADSIGVGGVAGRLAPGRLADGLVGRGGPTRGGTAPWNGLHGYQAGRRVERAVRWGRKGNDGGRPWLDSARRRGTGRGRHRASRSLGFLDPVAADHTPPSALKETADTITEYLGHGGGAVVEDAGSIVGAVLWNEEKGSLYVGRLTVHPEHRRPGIAAALLESAEREARRRGLPVMRLGVRLALAGNRRFFAA